LPDKFVVRGIIAKLPPSLKYFSTSLKHKKETMTIESLITSPYVEKKAKFKDVPRLFGMKASLMQNHTMGCPGSQVCPGN
jgi:hypothetical protein